MLVTMDLEWIEEKGIERLTQISARMYENGWKEVKRFQALLQFTNPNVSFYRHMAFTGYSMEQCLHGEPEDEAMERLATWLNDGDTLCFWCASGKRTLMAVWQRYFGKDLPYRVSLAKGEVLKALQVPAGPNSNPYHLLTGLGEKPPAEEHCAESDVEVLGSLLFLSGISVTSMKKIGQKFRPTTTAEKKRVSVQKKNDKMIRSSNYHYIFLSASPVFHRPGCACVRSAAGLHGCTYYETAAAKRRPCKLCKPDQGERVKRIKQQTAKKKKEISPEMLWALCGSTNVGKVNGISPAQILEWNSHAHRNGLNFFCRRETRDLFFLSDIAFWKIHWNKENEFVLYHLNSQEFDSKKTACELSQGHFHRQSDVPVGESLGTILFYIQTHDRAKKIIADDYRKLPRRTKREKHYYQLAKEKDVYSRKKRLFDLLDQVAEELKRKEEMRELGMVI